MNKFVQQLKYQFNSGALHKASAYKYCHFFLFGVFVIVFKLMLWNPAALIDFKDFFSLFKTLKFITHPWGIFTYMFMHHDFWHLFGNMYPILHRKTFEKFGIKGCLAPALLVEYSEE